MASRNVFQEPDETLCNLMDGPLSSWIAARLVRAVQPIRGVAVPDLPFFLSLVQRQRDDNKNKICAFEGGGPRGQSGKSSKNAFFCGNQAPPSYGSGRYGFGVSGAQDSVLPRHVLCGDASRLLLGHFPQHLT